MAALAGASAITAKPVRGALPSRVAGRSRMVVCAAARPLWLPGVEPPKYLNGSLPGDYGFDPFRLAEDPKALKWYQQAELQNGRWAMLGAAGILGEDLLGKLGIAGPAAKVPWFEAGDYEYFAPSSSLFISELFLFGWVEARRWQDIVKPGSVNQDPIFTNNRLPDGEVGYPGKDDGQDPLENLFDHLAAPTAVNVLTLEPARLG